MVTAKEIGKKFKEEREKQGLTITEAAHQSRIHQKVLKDIENGVFDRIGSLYVKSFIKKYSLFLEMNTAELVKLYNEVSTEMPKKEFIIENNNKKEDNDEFLAVNSKKLQYAFIGILFIVLVVLVMVFVGMLRSKLKKIPKTSPVAVTVKNVTHQSPPQQIKRSGFFGAKKNVDAYSFGVKATGDVWVQIKKEDKLIFAGIVKKGDTHSWDFNSPVKIWTGKAEYLQYIINGKNLGTFSEGVVKDILVSGQGVKINNEWAVRTD